MGEKKQARVRRQLWAIWPLLAALTGCKSEPEKPLPPLTEPLLVSMAADPKELADGKQLFVTVCASCHGAEGQGMVGPNLTDEAWIHGGSPLEIHTSISKGYPEKGMVAFEGLLGPRKVRSATAFVLSLKGKNVPGKAPEGPR
jgi:cytochrome c oxidase cbb3-type subunit III